MLPIIAHPTGTSMKEDYKTNACKRPAEVETESMTHSRTISRASSKTCKASLTTNHADKRKEDNTRDIVEGRTQQECIQYAQRQDPSGPGAITKCRALQALQKKYQLVKRLVRDAQLN